MQESQPETCCFIKTKHFEYVFFIFLSPGELPEYNCLHSEFLKCNLLFAGGWQYSIRFILQDIPKCRGGGGGRKFCFLNFRTHQKIIITLHFKNLVRGQGIFDFYFIMIFFIYVYFALKEYTDRKLFTSKCIIQ